jgi:hemerythrin
MQRHLGTHESTKPAVSAMPTIAWNEALTLDHPHLDGTHREFIDRLGALEEAVANAPGQVTEVLDELLRHTETHFAQEEQWMAQIGFSDGNCHAGEHRDVLELMREVRRRHVVQADLPLVGQLVAAIDQWFAMHAPKHDAGLVQVMAQAGFDPVTGTMTATVTAGAGALPAATPA